MFKKLLIAALAVFVGVAVLSGTRWGSFMRFNLHKAQDWAKDQVPLQAEIDRLKFEVRNLAQEDERYYDQLARQKMKVEELKKKVDAGRKALTKREDFVKDLRQALTQEGDFVVFHDGRQPRTRVETEYRSEALNFLADEKVLKADEANLAVLQKTLAANEAEVAKLKLQRKEMEAQLNILESELAQQRLEEQNRRITDDGRQGNVAKQIKELTDRFSREKIKAEYRNKPQTGSLRDEEEAKARDEQQKAAIDARFGPVDPAKVVSK
jgi:phage shock protein A